MCPRAPPIFNTHFSSKNIFILCFFGLFLRTCLGANTFTRKYQPVNEQVTLENQHQCLLRRITPYYNKPYKLELELKQKSALQIIENIRNKLKDEANTELPDFPVEQIVPSPETKSYRNKDDFSIYPGVDGNITVGYLSGSPALPGCVAVRPTQLSHIRESHKRLAQVFEDYVTQSIYKPCYSFNDGGFWKRLVVRSNEAGDMMAIVITHPSSVVNKRMEEERANLTAHMIKHEPDLILYHQECSKVDCTGDLKSYIHLAGDKPYIIETMEDKKFQISPHSFFQVNKQAAEGMVKNIWDEMDVTNETTFLDLYSGVGLYSIMGSHRVRQSWGVEMVEGAVMDANRNAEINNITNCKFTAGRVESILSALLKDTRQYADRVMTLINPGRAGTTKRVINMLRLDKRIKQIIYVSCKPDNQHTTNNFVQLCRKGGNIGGVPFTLNRVRLFDLFPKTTHFEMVLEFNRSS